VILKIASSCVRWCFGSDWLDIGLKFVPVLLRIELLQKLCHQGNSFLTFGRQFGQNFLEIAWHGVIYAEMAG